MVYVLSPDGKPLMPTKRHGKVRHLLEQKRAKVVKRTPFTIQLLYKPKTQVIQPVVLGVDAGSKTIGLSAATEKEELFAAEVHPRNDVVRLLSTRRQFRRARRNRKTRYRAPRFLNRVHSKHKGWLPPSIEVKIQEHITAILRVMRILPISKIIIETAEFDLQLINAVLDGKPVPVGEDYQNGEMRGFYNVRQYVFCRDKYTCCQCGVKHGEGIRFEVHHIESRKTGGNAPGNLITLCENCHKQITLGAQEMKNKIKRKPSTRDAAFMGIMRKTLIHRLKQETDVPIEETKGYITKYCRDQNNMPKSHVNDALCISGNPKAKRIAKVYTIRPIRHHNRQLHKATILKGGIRKRNQTKRVMFGFQLFDKVLFENKVCFVFGRRATGSFLLSHINGEKIKDGVSYKKLKLLEPRTNYLIN